MNSRHIRYIGGGRWATIVLTELVKNFPEISVDWVCQSNLLEKSKLIEQDDRFKNTRLVNKKDTNKLDKPDKIVIASHSSQHCSDFYEYKDFSGEILVEKPLFSSYSKFESLPDEMKQNIQLNLEFYNAFFLADFNKEVESIDINKVDIVWHDPLGEFRSDQEEKFSEIYSSIFMDQMLHVLSICKSLKLDARKYKNIRVSEGALNDTDSIKIKFDIDEIESSVSLSRFSDKRERRILLNNGEAELIFSAKPYFYQNNVFKKELSDSERLFPIAQTLSDFLYQKDAETNSPLSLKSLMPEIEFCFKCEDIFVRQVNDLLASQRELILSEDSPCPKLVYLLGILYYQFICGSPSINDIHYLKGEIGVRELLRWGRDFIDTVTY